MVLMKTFLRNAVIIKIVFLLIVAILFVSCGEDSNPSKSDFQTEGKSALIIVVENNDGLLNSNSELAFEMYKSPMLDIFTELFGVEKSKMTGMSLNTIIETYGETWQINHIKGFATGHYDQIISMRNEEVTEQNLKNKLSELSSQGYTLDMVFCLHGNENIVSFYNHQFIDIEEFALFIKSSKINLRMLYQTCCTAGPALPKWEKSGVYGINGAVGINNITLFSPGFFMEEWVKGKDFEEAVKNSFQRDIDTLSTYNGKVPVSDYILTSENISKSKQLVGGTNKKVKISNFLKTTVM